MELHSIASHNFIVYFYRMKPSFLICFVGDEDGLDRGNGTKTWLVL
jgi:hypothetical protein